MLAHNDWERNFVKGGKLVSQSVIGQMTGIYLCLRKIK